MCYCKLLLLEAINIFLLEKSDENVMKMLCYNVSISNVWLYDSIWATFADHVTGEISTMRWMRKNEVMNIIVMYHAKGTACYYRYPPDPPTQPEPDPPRPPPIIVENPLNMLVMR